MTRMIISDKEKELISAIIIIVMACFLVLQAFALGWYSGTNHARNLWAERDIAMQGDLERERIKNEMLADLIVM